MEKIVTIKDVGKMLTTYAYKHGHDGVQVFNDYLEYCCNVLQWVQTEERDFYKHMEACAKKNPDFFNTMIAMFEVMHRANLKGEAYDALGCLYEEMFQTASKASRTGQFFTPQSLCRMMADMTVPQQTTADEVTVYNDCACGSGRTLLAAWEKCDKYHKNYFSAQDIDRISVMMCALNFAENGMVGIVECQNTLSQEWYHGYIVNAVKVPYANYGISLEYYDDRDKFRARERKLMLLTGMWDIGKYRPKEEDKTA